MISLVVHCGMCFACWLTLLWNVFKFWWFALCLVHYIDICPSVSAVFSWFSCDLLLTLCTRSECLRNCGLVPSMDWFFSYPKHWLWFCGPTQPDVQWIPRSVGQGMMVTAGLHPVLRLRMKGAVLPFLHLLSWHLQRWLNLLSLWRQNMVNGLH